MDPHISQIDTQKLPDSPQKDAVQMDGGSLDRSQDGAVCGNIQRDAPPSGELDLLALLSDAKLEILPGFVERVDCPDSVLFLTDRHCYKLTQDLSSGQIAPMTLSQRHDRALEELKLGKSFAPDLYLGLVAVRLKDGHPYLDQAAIEDGSGQPIRMPGGNGDPIVEWLIKMRRYDISKSLSKSIEIYRPNFAECHQLADLLDKSADTDQSEGRHDACVWEQHLSGMLARFSPAVRAFEKKTKQPTLRACLNRAVYRLGALSDHFEDRCKRGLFDELHGNVGLENVVPTQKGLRLVNPAARPAVAQTGCDNQAWFGDPVYDLASLIAEMWARGLNRQANWVFSHYCNNLLDSKALDGLQAMDLYLFVSAFEKARHLSEQVVNQTDDSSLFRGYAQTARDSLVQDEAKLVVLGGSSHANRSHLARLLAPIIGRMPGAVYLSADQEILALYDVRRERDLPASAHRRSVWHLVYRRLATKARLALEAGYCVILSGAFDSPSTRQTLTLLRQDIGASLPLQAFHLFDPVSEQKAHSNAGRNQPWLRDLEHRSRLTSASSAFDRPITQESGLILSSAGDKLDWTNWTELDASRSVGSLVDEVLAQLNPHWVPMTKGTLH